MVHPMAKIGNDVGVAQENNNRKVDDTVTRGAPETTRCHEADGTNQASSTTPSTTGIPEAHRVSAERDKTEAGGRIGDTPELASKYGDMQAAQYGTHDIGGAQTNEGRGETGTDGGSGHLEGSENDHKAEISVCHQCFFSREPQSMQVEWAAIQSGNTHILTCGCVDLMPPSLPTATNETVWHEAQTWL